MGRLYTFLKLSSKGVTAMQNTIITFLRNWTLPCGIVAGLIGYPLFRHFSFLLPWLIFTMLLLTFCRIPLSRIRFTPLHFCLLAIQIGGSVLAYLLLAPMNALIAQGVMLCVIAPTGTAAAVVTDKLGGNAASLTSYAILGNLATAIAVPVIFPLLHPVGNGLSFWAAFWLILEKVFPLLVFPFIAAMLLRRFFPTVNDKLVRLSNWAFYLWGVTLMIIMGRAMDSLVNEPSHDVIALWLALAALAICFVQFTIGKRIGGFVGDRVTAGQALAQKNGALAVWMAITYLTPVTSIAATAYILWQNLFNAWQLWRKRVEESRQETASGEGNGNPVT